MATLQPTSQKLRASSAPSMSPKAQEQPKVERRPLKLPTDPVERRKAIAQIAARVMDANAELLAFLAKH